MRHLRSEYVTTAVETGELDAAAAEKLCEAITARLSEAERESYCTDRIGQRSFLVALVTYRPEPDGPERYAVHTLDNNGSWFSDTADRAEADEHYEYEVRQLANCADPSMYAWWDRTDLDDLKQCGFHYELDVRADGNDTWTRVDAGSGKLGDLDERDEPRDYVDHEDEAEAIVRHALLDDERGYREARVVFYRDAERSNVITEQLVDVAEATA
ncbi:hypothetical protein [Nocardia sp. NRRL S-836]|uniref:hypothetical protein n=1 Tax=Nocardia sp. NRRL S-836 TaxID=1519492 RepID=UPI0006AFAB5C|nr:hypothetical protein [Nocardia sp. NRRL S-836]KOV84653.1 hypothetical protein ADL03_15300 [Nocardia sp. NRRL S-836]